MSPALAPTLRRQIQCGFLEESSYGVRNEVSEASIIRPVVRAFSITPTQERMNVGRTGQIDPSRSFFSTQTYEYTMTIEADPHMSMWFLKWALGAAYDISDNRYRIVPLPLNQEIISFTMYLDTQQDDFIRDANRTIMFLGGAVQTLTLRSNGREADTSVVMEISGPAQQPNTDDEYPYEMIGAGLTLPLDHPLIGFEDDNIVPYIHQNFTSEAQSPSGLNLEMLDIGLTINNTLKMNTYPDADNEPFFSDLIYQGRQLQIEWTAEYKSMLEYHLFHEAKDLVGFNWTAEHLLRYAMDLPYKMSVFFPKVAISNAGFIIEAGNTEDTLEQTYTADLLNRADLTPSPVTTPANQDIEFADDANYHAVSFTGRDVTGTVAAVAEEESYLTHLSLGFEKSVVQVAGVDTELASIDLTMYIVTAGTGEPGDMTDASNILATSNVVKTDWISNQPLGFKFESPPKLVESTTYWMVLGASAEIATGFLDVKGDTSGTGTSQASTDSGASWGTAGTDQWDYTLGWDGIAMVIEVDSDADYTP